MLSAVAGRMLRAGASKALILQHREELLTQNATKFRKINPEIGISVVNADRKDWRGDAVFSMEPTLRRASNLEAMPPVDLVVIDEAHHASADGYERIIETVRKRNPGAKLLGVTATPNRGDKIKLDHIFDNVADQIEIRELIASGHLVKPRTFVIDVGVTEQLKKVRKTVSDFDMDEVAAIMDREVVTSAVIRHWEEKAGDRRTIVFCSKITHAEHVAAAFRDAGHNAEIVHSDLSDERRRSIIKAYAAGKIQVIVNVAILTEGFDDQTTSCVVLLRPCSYKSTMIQMIGRGLRVVDPDLHPGIIKNDCIILDFGRSILTHGTIEQKPDLHPKRHCKKCQEMVDYDYDCDDEKCPFVKPVFPEGEDGGDDDDDEDVLSEFVMSEIDIFAKSNFRWLDLFGDDLALMAAGFRAWAGAFCDPHGVWHAIGGGKGVRPKRLGGGERIVAIALGDDWMNERESDDAAHKTRRWLVQPATEAQMQWLDGMVERDPLGLNTSVNRYHASCLMSFKFAKPQIKALILQ